MMDSQENALQNGVNENEKGKEQDVAQVNREENKPEDLIAETENVCSAESMAEEQPSAHTYRTKKEILARLKEIVANKEFSNKEEIDHLKTSFYKIHIAEREARLKDYLNGGGDPEKYQILPDEDESIFKAEMSVIRENRTKIFQQQEAEKQENLEKKLDIINKIKAMATSPEQANKSYSEFKELQQQWKEIKSVPANKASELWRSYQLYVEQFYDLLKLNNEAREYDFKKNLELKTKLCESAERLAEEPDVISAFHQLQELHQQYREIGPVAKDLRESIWARFKAASTVINKRHQQHFESLRAKEEDNLARKTELCEKAEAIAKEENKGASDWEKHTKEIIALQAEWKTIGSVPKKIGDQLWNDFLEACNKFFAARNAANAGVHNEERANLEKKRSIIEQLRNFTAEGVENVQEKIQQLVDEYNAVGHVPYKEKDNIYNEYHAVLDKLYKELNISSSRRKLDSFRSNLKNVAKRGEDALDNERGRLMRRYDQLRQEIQTYENNLGFLTASSKKGNSLVDEMNRKVQKLKDDMELVKQKIKAIDAEQAD